MTLQTLILPGLRQTASELTPEDSFNYVWVSSLLEQVLQEVEAKCHEDGKTVHWHVFHDWILEPIMEKCSPPSMTEICRRYGLQSETKAFSTDRLRQLSGSTPGDSEAALHDWVRQATGGLCPGALVEYFSRPTQTVPVTTRVFETVDIGMRFQANFPKVWYDYWDKPEMFPVDAQGPFRLRITAKLYVPATGNYCFYIKTVIPNRATVSIETPGGKDREIISPHNDDKLQYVMQAGMPTHRIDFSGPIPMKKA